MLDLVIFQSIRTLVTIALAIYLAVDLWRLNRAGPALAVKEIDFDRQNPDRIVVLHGRQTGILAWIYTRLGLEADARLELTARDIRVERQSLKGFSLQYAPTHDLSASTCGYYRAISLALVAVSLITGGFLQLYTAWGIENPYDRLHALELAGRASTIAAVFAVLAYALFELSKRMAVSVETTGGEKMGIALKRNVLDNVTIGLAESRQVATLLNRAILAAAGRAPAMPQSGAGDTR